MKNFALLTSVLVLAACGGGSGGGSDVAPSNIPDTIDARVSNANVSSSFSNAEKRIAVAENNYAAANEDFPTLDELHTNSNTANNSARHASLRSASNRSKTTLTDVLIDAMYANMYYWLIQDGGHIPDSIAGKIQYKHALILAGLIGLDLNNMTNDEIATAVENSGIKDQAEILYTELGTLQTFDGTNIEWFTSPDDTGANDKITFHIDSENKKVTGITFVANENTPSRERTIEMIRQGDTNTYTANNVHIYQYGLYNIECIGTCPDDANQTYDPEAHLHGGRNLDISLTEPLTSTEQIKAKLLAEIDLAYSEGFFHTFHNALSQDDYIACDSGDGCNNGYRLDQDKVANKLRDAAIARVNNWENETNKIVEQLDLNVENNLTTYGKLVGLAYSDFGTMDLTMTADGFNQHDSKLIYGGYKDKKVETADIAQNMEFSGVAKGRVISRIKENHSDNVLSSKTKDLQDDNAKLVFNRNNQQETLTMSFKDNDWYDVTVTKDSSHNPNITFTDNTASKISTDYKFIGHQSGDVYAADNFTQTNQNIDFNGDGITGSKGGTMGIAYYGAQEHNPSEAVGYVTYQENEPYRTDPDHDWEAREVKDIDFAVGFGMQKDITKNNN